MTENFNAGGDSLKDFSERLRIALGDRKSRPFALAAGVTPSSLNQYLRAKQEPTRPNLIAMAKEGNVNLEWLMCGTGPMRKDDVPEAPAPQAAHEYPPFIKPVVMTRIIGVLLSNETDGRYPPLKEVAERICKYYLTDCWDYINGTRPIPPEASTEAIESLRTRKPIPSDS